MGVRQELTTTLKSPKNYQTMQMEVSQSEFRRMEEKLESLEETLEVLADKKLLSSIRKSLDDIKQGKYQNYASAKGFRAKFESRF